MNTLYEVHVAELGWMPRVFKNGEVAGTVGESKSLQAFNIALNDVPEGTNIGIAYNAHVQDIGWLDHDHVNGEYCGTTGQGKHIEAVKIFLFGNDANKYHVFYRLHVANLGFMNWSQDGQINGTVGGNNQAEALQVIVTDDESFRPYPGVNTTNAFVDLTPPPAPAAPANNPQAQIIANAASYVGYVSGTSSDSAFGRRLVGPGAGDWCCYYVVCCALDAGLSVPVTGYVPTMYQWALDSGRFTTTPQPGMFVLFDFNGNGTPDHIGIVEGVGDGFVNSIEGNTDQGNGIGVYRVQRSWGILGYVNPF